MRAAVLTMTLSTETNAMKEPELLDIVDPPTVDVLALLLSSHQRFLSFLERRVGSRAIAEEILQSALAKAIERVDSLEHETVVAWFYRVLKNALIDHYRKQDAEQRALEAKRQELVAEGEDLPELARTVCECLQTLLPTIKPEYHEIVRLVDLGDSSVSEAAERLRISPNHASVRLHRARKALKVRLEQTCQLCASHGCLDCSCGKN
jgi:RNA polymerase sigma factor (sigma-70 family)